MENINGISNPINKPNPSPILPPILINLNAKNTYPGPPIKTPFPNWELVIEKFSPLACLIPIII